MKPKTHNFEIILNADIQKVTLILSDPNQLYSWIEEMKKIIPQKGLPLQEGSEYIIVFKYGKHEIQMYETIQVMSLPEEMKGLQRLMYNEKPDDHGPIIKWRTCLISLNANQTLIKSSYETHNMNIFLYIISWLSSSSTEKMMKKQFNSFKEYVEKNT